MAYVKLGIHSKLGTPLDALEHAQEIDADDQSTFHMILQIHLAVVIQGIVWHGFQVWSSHQGFSHHLAVCQQISVAAHLGAHHCGHEQVS